ncbi:MAG: hypothetical protein BWK80_41565 [Desulfobacteraceae bacterium IS3]|nr:MAG: hypothetical protein BWK80_41565 [Desulfobacteraceae bacterium IS3]
MFRCAKFKVVVSVICCLTVLMIPFQAQAFLDLSFDILSFGPFSIGIGIPLRGLLPLLGAGLLVGAAISFFSGIGSSRGSYAASYPNSEPLTRHVKVTISSDEHYKGEPLRIRLNHHRVLDEKDRIPLHSGGWLEIQYDTGRMVFRGTDFEGYVLFHYNRSLSVWDRQDNPVLVLTLNEDKLLILQEKSAKGTEVSNLLLGGGK